MLPRRVIALGSILAIVVALLGTSTAGAKPSFVAFGSCGTAKPPKAAKHCHFAGDHPRGTFVFRSNVGKQALKVCSKITGLPFHGRQCEKADKPIAYESIPFDVKGATRGFKVVVTFYVRVPRASGPYKQVGRAALSYSR